MLKKRDLKLIGEFIDKGNPKFELNFALITDGGIYATDTRKFVNFNLPDFRCEDMLAHKKVLKLVEGFLGKNGHVAIESNGDVLCDMVSVSLDNANDEAFKDGEFKFPDYNKILDQRFDNHFVLDKIEDIIFELAQVHCFIDSYHLNPLIEHDGGKKYDVFYNEQSEESSGMVKIVASVNDEELGSVMLYTVVVMGYKFESQAK